MSATAAALAVPRAEGPRAPLSLVAECVVIPGDGVLHLLTRRGSFDVLGKDVPRLHQRLEPFLRGTHTEAELTAAVPPPLAPAVRAYLGRLRDLGALREGAHAGAPVFPKAVRALGAARPRASFRAGGVDVRVSLYGPAAPPRHGLRLCFVESGEAARVLRRLRGPGDLTGRLTCVVAEPADAGRADEELERRAGYARWLLRNELDVLSDDPRLQLFRLDAESGELRRLAAIEAADLSDLATLSDQLAIVRAADVDQLPLAVGEASHPFFQASAAAYGLSFPAVRDHLLRAFFARALLRPGAIGQCLFLAGSPGAPRASRDPVRVPRRAAERAAAAPTRAALELALLEKAAERRATADGLAWEEGDLLAHDAREHSAVTYLRDLLRLRMPRLPTRTAVTPEGLFVWETGARRTRSFLRDRALAEALLGAAWDEFHGGGSLSADGEPPHPACDHAEFASPAGIRRLARERAAALARAGITVRTAVRRLRCWGMSFWVGVLCEEAEDAEGMR